MTVSTTALFRLLLAAGLLLADLGLTAGCSHYQLGTGGKLAFRSLYLAPVENKTLLPDARALVSTRLREAFARDGRVDVANSPETADATLTVVITDYHRDVATVREGDTGLARKFNLTLGTSCTLRDNRGAKNFFENRPVGVQRESFTDSGQLQSEYQTLPLLAESLADKLAHAVLDVW
jgi:hypothetical protein